MTAMARVRNTWDLARICTDAGAAPPIDIGRGPRFVNDPGETGWGVLTIPDVTQGALDAALAAWLEANPQ
jgi:hypothetical protein